MDSALQADYFDLTNRVAVITGGAGLLGIQHAEAIAEQGGIPVLWDVDRNKVCAAAELLKSRFGRSALGMAVDVTSRDDVGDALVKTLNAVGRIDILINNAAHNPAVSATGPNQTWSRFESFSLEAWNADLAVGLTGAFLCSQLLGAEMARRRKGVILNISSDLGLIAPDQRLYEVPNLPADLQPVKPVTYSVVKTGLIGLTRYLATYWADRGVRANVLCPGGVEDDQPDDFKQRLASRIPMGRMAHRDEYKAAVLFLVSDASSYMTGATLVVDGGRTCW